MAIDWRETIAAGRFLSVPVVGRGGTGRDGSFACGRFSYYNTEWLYSILVGIVSSSISTLNLVM